MARGSIFIDDGDLLELPPVLLTRWQFDYLYLCQLCGNYSYGKVIHYCHKRIKRSSAYR